MNKKFKLGDVIGCVGSPVKVVRWLAEGGQGDVYIVEQNGQQKALKWYKPGEWVKIPRHFMKI